MRYLKAFFAARKSVMQTEEAHQDTSRIDTAQAVFLRQRNFALRPPLTWHVYGQRFHLAR